MTSTEQVKDFEYEAIKTSVEYYFGKLLNHGDWVKAKELMRRVKALVDSKLAILEKAEIARNYEADCPKCGSCEVEWIEKIHECLDCQVWVLSCLECKAEWLDLIWRTSK